MGQCAIRNCLEDQATDLDRTNRVDAHQGGGGSRAPSATQSSPVTILRSALPTGMPPLPPVVGTDPIGAALPPLSEHTGPAAIHAVMVRIVEAFSTMALSAQRASHSPYAPPNPKDAPFHSNCLQVLVEAVEALARPETIAGCDGNALPTQALVTPEALQYAATSYGTVLAMLGAAGSTSRKGREGHGSCDDLQQTCDVRMPLVAVEVTTRVIDTPLAAWFLRPVKVDARLLLETDPSSSLHCARPSAGVPSAFWVANSERGSQQRRLSQQRAQRTNSSLDRIAFSPSASALGWGGGGGRAASPMVGHLGDVPSSTVGGRHGASPTQNHFVGALSSHSHAVYDADALVAEDVLHDRLVEGLVTKSRNSGRATSPGLNASGRCDSMFASHDDVDAIMGLIGKGYRCPEPSNEERDERFSRGIAKARLSGVFEPPQDSSDNPGTGKGGRVSKRQRRASPALVGGDLSCCLRYPSQQQQQQQRPQNDTETGCRTLEDVELVLFQNPETIAEQQPLCGEQHSSSSYGALAPGTPTHLHAPSTTTYNFSCDSPATLAAQLSNNASTTDFVNRRSAQHLSLIGLAAQRLLLLSACWTEAEQCGGFLDAFAAQPLEAPAMLWEMQPRLCHLVPLLSEARSETTTPASSYGWDCVAPLCAARRNCAVYMILLASGVPPEASLGTKLLLTFSGYLWKPPVDDHVAASGPATTLSQSSHGSDSSVCGAVSASRAIKPAGGATNHVDALVEAASNERNDGLMIWLIVQFRVNSDPCRIPDMT